MEPTEDVAESIELEIAVGRAAKARKRWEMAQRADMSLCAPSCSGLSELEQDGYERQRTHEDVAAECYAGVTRWDDVDESVVDYPSGRIKKRAPRWVHLAMHRLSCRERGNEK